MGIVRVAKTTNYVRIENAAVRDTRLSFGARGVLAYALSKPDNWILTTADVVKQSKAGRTAVLAWFRELEKFGYLKRVKFRCADGSYDWAVTVFEQPITACNNPQSGCPTMVDPPDKEEPNEEEPESGTEAATVCKPMTVTEHIVARNQRPDGGWNYHMSGENLPRRGGGIGRVK